MPTKKTNQIGHTIYADDIVLTKPPIASRARTTLDVNMNLVVIDKAKLLDTVTLIASDQYLTVAEKQSLKREWESINSRHLNLVTEVLEIGMEDSVFYTDYLASYNALKDVLDIILADMTVGTDISSYTAFVTLFDTYYTDLQVMWDKIFAYNTGFINGVDIRTKMELDIISSLGNSLKAGDTTTLSVSLLNENVDITATYDASCFTWERISNDPAADLIWNASHTLTGKNLDIEFADLVAGISSFMCFFEYYVSEFITYKKNGSITINELLQGPSGEDAYQTQVISHGGTTFRMGEDFSTLMEIMVWQGGENITSLFNDEDFRWRRESLDTQGDLVWNSAHYSTGGKQITITQDDVAGKCSFFCDLLRTRS